MSPLAGLLAYSSHTGPERVDIYESSLKAGLSMAGQIPFPAGEGLGAVLSLWVGCEGVRPVRDPWPQSVLGLL